MSPAGIARQTWLSLLASGRGVTTADVCRASGCHSGQAGNAVLRLHASGQAHQAYCGHKMRVWFADPAAAAAHQRVHGKQHPPKGGWAAAAGSSTIKSTRGGCGWPADTPAHYPRHADGSPAYKVTIAAPPPAPTRTNTHLVYG